MPMTWLAAFLLLAVGAACGRGHETHASDRGAGLTVATLSASEQAAAYAAALREAFDMGPRLVLLVDTAVLPSDRSGESTHALPADVVQRLRAVGVVQGTCRPRSGGDRVAPICAARRPGYVVQFSDVFNLARDTVQLYVTAERFRATSDSTSPASPLYFEQRYNLARRRGAWRVTTKARLVH
jgi:hypothetical protein